MSLPSQSSRSSRSSAVQYRKSNNSPIRRFLPVVVVVGLALILWFALTRPSKATSDEAGLDQASDLTNAVLDQPVVIDNSSSNPAQTLSRALPGSGDRPDTNREVDQTIAKSSPSSSTTSDTNGLQPIVRSSNPDTSSLLDATRNQTNQPAQQPVASTPARTTPAAGSGRVGLQLDTAQRMVDQNDRVAARRLLSQTLHNTDPSSNDARRLREALTEINSVLVFGPVVASNDAMCEEYTIQSGDSLSRIASRRELTTHWKLIQRVNRIANPARIRLGQNLKLVRGPFHAIVYKGEHRMDVYHGPPNTPSEWLYIRSFDVGLGTDNGTPVGLFTISTNKLENPGWVNPRDASESYTPDDPRNPIGEFWLGLDGVGQYAGLSGYGLHGTIDQDSIGDNQSMGCVRLAKGDIDIVYELLAERVSVVEIKP